MTKNDASRKNLPHVPHDSSCLVQCRHCTHSFYLFSGITAPQDFRCTRCNHPVEVLTVDGFPVPAT